MLETLIQNRKDEISDKERQHEKSCKIAAQMLPLIKAQLEPMRALSDFTIRQSGSTIEVQFERRLPGAVEPRLIVEVTCETLITISAVVITSNTAHRHPGVSYAGEYTLERMTQRALHSCEPGFKKLINNWIK